MENLANSEIFYVFASISLVFITLCSIALIAVFIFIALKVKKIVKKIDEQVHKLSDDIDSVRATVQEKSNTFGGILQTLIGAFVVKKAVTKTRKKKTNK